MVKVEHPLVEAIPPDTDPQLRLHALEYLYDTVGWSLYCTGKQFYEDDDDKVEDRPAREQTINLGEDGEILEEKADAGPKRPVKKKKKKNESGVKPLKVKKEPWDEYRLIRKSLKDVYRTKDHYLNWLREQYDKELQFYRAILKGDKSYTELYPELAELDIFDSDLEDEIQASTKSQLEEIAHNLREETKIINGISDEDWERVARSPNPKITLALVLGASSQEIKENFQTSILVRMRAQRMGQRSAFYTWTGPKMWTGLEDFEVQVDRLVDAVLEPIIAFETAGLIEEGLGEDRDSVEHGSEEVGDAEESD
jgi:hypothetical protein